MKPGDLITRYDSFSGDLFSDETRLVGFMGVRIQMGEVCMILEVRGDTTLFGSSLRVLGRETVGWCSPAGMKVIRACR